MPMVVMARAAAIPGTVREPGCRPMSDRPSAIASATSAAPPTRKLFSETAIAARASDCDGAGNTISIATAAAPAAIRTARSLPITRKPSAGPGGFPAEVAVAQAHGVVDAQLVRLP